MDLFTGGVFETNAFFLPKAGLLIDAPEDTAQWLARRGHRVQTLVLTHGHIDHVWDAARIQREHACVLRYHPATAPMVLEADFYRKLGMPWEVDPVQPGEFLDEGDALSLGEWNFEVLHVPGHCPGSLCLFERQSGVLFGGDVLFAGGVGRWDLPGGDRDLLLGGIRSKLFPLGDSVRVLPGHGPATTIGVERVSNPYLEE
jgi:hydroxyacylglutathione hydrolase